MSGPTRIRPLPIQGSRGAVSPDGRWLALDKPRTSADSDIYLVDLESEDKEPVLITEHDGNIAYGASSFTPDGKQLVYSTNEHGEFSQHWTYDLETGDRELLVAADWDVMYTGFSQTGRYRASGINADARTEVLLNDTQSGEAVSLPELPPGDLNNLRFAADDSRLALIVNSDISPSDVYLIDLDAGTSKRLTDAMNPDIDRDHLVASEVVRYESFDGLEIPAILYRPHGASADDPVPALVWVHGGPGGQSRTGYSATRQHLVNHGYAILAANNRGSSGYGKTFFHMDDRRHGEEDLQDIVYGRKYLESLDWVAGDKIGVTAENALRMGLDVTTSVRVDSADGKVLDYNFQATSWGIGLALDLPIVPLYLSAERPTVVRDGALLIAFSVTFVHSGLLPQ